MRIVALGSFGEAVQDEPRPLKRLVEATVGSPVRRIGRFIQLALIGAGHCVRPGEAPDETAVFLASGRGDLEVTLDVLTEIFVRHEAPMPLSFVNTVSNSACFHLARTFGLFGRSMFVTSRYAPFESALRLAALDLATGTKAALAGVVDVYAPPLADHRRRICVSADAAIGEASHWALLEPPAAAGRCLGRIPLVCSFVCLDDLSRWLRQQSARASVSVFAPGQHLDTVTAAYLREISGISAQLDYRAGLPFYDSQSGAALAAFLNQHEGERMIHVDGDPTGRFAVMVVERA